MTHPGEPATAEILDEKRLTVVQLCILLFCLLIMMLEGMDVLIISFTAPAISEEMAVSAEAMGIVFSAALLGGAFGALLVAPLADKYGRRSLVSFSLLLTGLTTLAVFAAQTSQQIAVLRFFTGIGIGTLIAVLPGLTGEFSPARYRNLILAVLISGATIGAVIGGTIASWAIPLFGWRSLYFYTGAVTAIAALLFYIFVPDSVQYCLARRRATVLDEANRTLRYIGHPPLTALPPQTGPAPDAAAVKALLTPARRNVTLSAWACYFVTYEALYFAKSWMPKLLTEAGISSPLAINAVVIMNTGGLVGTLLLGFMSRWYVLNRLVSWGFVAAALSGLALSLLMHRAEDGLIIWVWLLSFMLGFSLLGASSNLYTIALKIYPTQIRVTGLGWCLGVGRIGSIISPAAAGVMMGMGIHPANVLAIFTIIAVFSAILVKRVPFREMT